MKKILTISIITFILNFLWEISQAFLYAPHFVGTGGLIKIHIRASLGDLLIVFLILLIDAIISTRIFPKENSKKRFVAIAITGFISAVIIEKYALTIGRWSYNPLMPIIPILNVGLIPILQMIILPVLIFHLQNNKRGGKLD